MKFWIGMISVEMERTDKNYQRKSDFWYIRREENEEGNKTIPGFLNWVIEAVGSVLVENVCLHLLLQLFMSDT